MGALLAVGQPAPAIGTARGDASDPIATVPRSLPARHQAIVTGRPIGRHHADGVNVFVSVRIRCVPRPRAASDIDERHRMRACRQGAECRINIEAFGSEDDPGEACCAHETSSAIRWPLIVSLVPLTSSTSHAAPMTAAGTPSTISSAREEDPPSPKSTMTARPSA